MSAIAPSSHDLCAKNIYLDHDPIDGSQVSIPHDIQVPSDATHLAVAAENEDRWGAGGGCGG